MVERELGRQLNFERKFYPDVTLMKPFKIVLEFMCLSALFQERVVLPATIYLQIRWSMGWEEKINYYHQNFQEQLPRYFVGELYVLR